MKVELEVNFATGTRGRKRAIVGGAPDESTVSRLPRITKLMALAIRFRELVRSGEVADCAEVARLGRVTRARMTQIMNLLHLAPDIQEALLDLPRMASGRDPVTERDLRPIVAEIDWRRQRRMWRAVAPADRC